jgi:hypothetical protein
VHQGEEEEERLGWRQLAIEAVGEGVLGDGHRVRIEGEGGGRPPVDVPRELVEQQHQREAVAGRFLPAVELAPRGPLDERPEVQADLCVHIGAGVEPQQVVEHVALGKRIDGGRGSAPEATACKPVVPDAGSVGVDDGGCEVGQRGERWCCHGVGGLGCRGYDVCSSWGW